MLDSSEGIDLDLYQIGIKLDKYAMERGFAVKKGCTRTCKNGSVWNTTWVCYQSGQ
ncbi:36399_t:CDS:2 [Gigaspora margarita]|uniref:36399_t:CDS:1 n=1 Tax=Gigaspora margarita TaxID=4874 RepID=A0ABN7VC60_GIGMA|nr:36399_t:CDS:2 [Gigaspora margarita]